MKARYFDSGLARFLSVDPGSDSINPAVPQTWNLYAYARNNPLNRIDPNGETDIYIGGLGDQTTEIVSGYVSGNGSSPGRTVAYFSHDQVDKAIKFANESLGNGEPLNIIGHSWGADSAIDVAKGVDGQVDNLVGVDPVNKPLQYFGGARPENVDNVVTVMADPSDPDASDAVAAVGRAAGGTPKAFKKDADTTIKVDANHDQFGKLYTTPGSGGQSAKDIVDRSYEDKSKN